MERRLALRAFRDPDTQLANGGSDQLVESKSLIFLLLGGTVYGL
jgi:hypothetical protein